AIARGPEFCSNDFSTSCDTATPCNACPGGTCTGAGNTTCVGGTRDTHSCTGGTCTSQQVSAIAVPLVDVGSQPPQVIISRNRLELTDDHNGIVLTGANGAIISHNRITAIDSGTALTKVFQGIGLNATATKPLLDVVVEGNE